MNKQLAKKTEIEVSLSDQITALENSNIIPKGTPPAQIQLFMMTCQMSGLNPIKKEAYLVPYKDKKANRMNYHIIVGVGGQRKIAADTGLYAGCDAATFDGGMSTYEFMQSANKLPTTCSYTVYKIVKGIRVPFTAEVVFSEYSSGKQLWHAEYGKPHTMISKVAEIHALRKAFPEELSAYYIEEEVDAGTMDVVEVQDAAQEEVTKKSEASTSAAIEAIKKASKQEEPAVEEAEAIEVESSGAEIPFE